MTRTELLLTQIGEECAEVIQEVSKSLRFGLDDYYKDEPKNIVSLYTEAAEVIAVLEMFMQECPIPDGVDMDEIADRKKLKVEKYLEYSKERGILTE